MEFCDTAPALHAIAVAEAADEPLDLADTAAERDRLLVTLHQSHVARASYERPL